MKKTGYTLAETLVTLAVMGVIAGILFPVISKKIPNAEMLGFKKAYATLVNSSIEMVNDETLYDEQLGLRDTRGVNFGGEYYSGNTKFCGILAAKLGTTCRNGRFTTTDGMVWQVPASDFSNGIVTIVVDVNGTKGENRTENGAIHKPDQFSFLVTPQGRLILPDGSIEQAYRDTDDTSKTFKELRTEAVVERQVQFDFDDD